ncbi:DCD domain-containing protein NRP-A-like [Diospyros lotus]|uniref:DCD domain-containing protein NRP-A-like n=1 Tax=Diospyros lotus TaxID=55363 RepID=UPI002258EBB6|nr:DCD domain-containing protein NRP-A-like [Diospyros lotus]
MVGSGIGGRRRRSMGTEVVDGAGGWGMATVCMDNARRSQRSRKGHGLKDWEIDFKPKGTANSSCIGNNEKACRFIIVFIYFLDYRMGKGRRTNNFRPSGSAAPAPTQATSHVKQRGLAKSHLGGVIFGCTNSTIKECFSKQLFGLPAGHHSYIKNIHAGQPLFLFNYSDRQLHGIFAAASPGQMNINPYAWTIDGEERTQYPAQVYGSLPVF